MEGTLLVPKTRRRTSPNVRTTSSASPHASSIDAFPWTSARILCGRLGCFGAEFAAALRARQFSASQRGDFEHVFESQSWRLVRLLSRRRFRYFIVRIIIVVQLSLPRFTSEIVASAGVALDVMQPQPATPSDHANISRSMPGRPRLCGTLMP